MVKVLKAMYYNWRNSLRSIVSLVQFFQVMENAATNITTLMFLYHSRGGKFGTGTHRKNLLVDICCPHKIALVYFPTNDLKNKRMILHSMPFSYRIRTCVTILPFTLVQSTMVYPNDVFVIFFISLYDIFHL